MNALQLPANRDHSSLEEELRRLDALRGIDLHSVRELLEQCPSKKLQKKEQLLASGEINRTMYMVLSGRLGVYLDSSGECPIAFIEAGQTVGELSVIDGEPASANVLAIESTHVLGINEEIFWSLVHSSHTVSINLLLLLSDRLRVNNSQLSTAREMRQRFEREALVDGLTGIHNRRWLDQSLPRLVTRSARDQTPLSVLVLDVDFFKHFNDAHGHSAGDAVLREVAETLVSSVRPTDLLARYGGEEFVANLPNTAANDAHIVAERLRKAIEAKIVTHADGTQLPPVTISIGVAELANDDDASSLLARADEALYRAKANGRNRVEG